MSHRAAWIVGIVALAIGIGFGAAVTYLLLPPREPGPGAMEAPRAQGGRGGREGAASDPAPPPRLEPAEVRADAILAACNLFPAKSYRVRGFNTAYYYLTESNTYKEGHSVISSNSGMV